MPKKIFTFLSSIPLLIVVLIASVLRIQNLGYSDYQGDEIKALYLPTEGNNLSLFFLDQRRGPGQYLMTALVKIVNPRYSNEFLTRIAFAIAGILAVYFFYKLVELHFNKKIAFYSAFFIATNGFFVAFSRIAQYQSFVILFMILSLFYFSKSTTTEKGQKRSLFLGFFFWALGFLFHYDALFIAPFVFYLVMKWFKTYAVKTTLKDSNYKYLLLVLAITGSMVVLFYGPFISRISSDTFQYWSGRISGDVSAKLSSSRYLFTVYQPIYVLHFYTLLAIMGTLYYLGSILRKTIGVNLKFQNVVSFDNNPKTTLAIFLWAFLPFVFLEGLVYIPGTHIYTYLLPLTIIMSLGIVFVEKIFALSKNYILTDAFSYAGISVLIVFLFLQSYAIYVDHDKEYPWENEKFLIWELSKPAATYHLSMFGFPYYRNWEGIRNTILASDNNGYYSTNEQESIARFYIPFIKDTHKAGHFIHILNPQSFSDKIQNEKALYWSERYPPIFTFSRAGKDLVRVYYMKPGTIAELIAQGY